MICDQKQKIEFITLNKVRSYTEPNPLKPLPWSKLGRIEVIKKWSEEIKAALKSSENIDQWDLVGHGITLLHGDLDHCRNIFCRVAQDVGFEFLSLNENCIEDTFSKIDNELKLLVPTLVYLEPAEWMTDIEDMKQVRSEIFEPIQKSICNLIGRFNHKTPVIFCTSIDNYEDFSPRFRKQGLFDRRFLVPELSLTDIAENFLEELGEDLCGSSLNENMTKLGKLLQLEFYDKRRIGLIAISLKRLAFNERRKIEFADLGKLAMCGSLEFDDFPAKSDEILRSIATHEAGHVTVAIIDSNGENVPEYATIIETDDYLGHVTDSYLFHHAKTNNKTYTFFKHQVRIFLAGRVAEHLMFGSENIRLASARSDLTKATEMCYEMFGALGVSSQMETDIGASKNLAIDPELSPNNLTRLEDVTREFLDKQYQIVYKMLEVNIEIFKSITESLLTQQLLDQKDLIKILNDSRNGHYPSRTAKKRSP